jgi:hypothetical protein
VYYRVSRSVSPLEPTEVGAARHPLHRRGGAPRSRYRVASFPWRQGRTSNLTQVFVVVQFCGTAKTVESDNIYALTQTDELITNQYSPRAGYAYSSRDWWHV